MTNIGIWFDHKTMQDLRDFIQDERFERMTILKKLIEEHNEDAVSMGELVGMLCTVERLFNEALEFAAKNGTKTTAKGAVA